MRISRFSWLSCLAAVVFSTIPQGPLSGQIYFDYDNTSGLTPTGNITPVLFDGNYWQNSAAPGVAAPGTFVDVEMIYFSTGGINLLELPGNLSIYDLYQTGAGTQTTISGAGTLTLTGDLVENASGEALTFGDGVNLHIIADSGDYTFDAVDGAIVINGGLIGTEGLRFDGDGGIELNGDNSGYTGTMKIAGLVIAGHADAFGGPVLFEGGTLRYAAGLVTDYSAKFAAGSGFAIGIDTNGNNITWASDIGGGNDLVKTGAGRLYLAGNMPTFNGKITVEQGILSLGNGANPAGNSGNTILEGIQVNHGATLDISHTVNTLQNEYITLAGHGVGNLGALMNNITGTKSLNRVYLTDHVTLNVNVRWDFDGLFQGNGFSVTKIGSVDVPFEQGNSQNIGNIYIKQGTVNFTGATDMGHVDKTVFANSGAGLTFYSGANDSKKMTLNGGYIQRNSTANASRGAVITVVDGLGLTAGASEIRHGNSQLVFALGDIQRVVGSTLYVRDTSGIVDGAATGNPALATTTLEHVNGILGGWLLYGNNTWAQSSGATTVGTTTNVIVGMTTGFASDFNTATNNVDVTGSATTPAGWTVNSVRFNAPGAATLTLSGVNTITSGGLLVTPGVGANTTRITGGTLRGSASGDLIVHQNNTSGVLEISSIIADNGGATALTKSGNGVLNLRQVNTYTGNTYINGAAGSGSRGIVDVTDLKTAGNDNLGSTANQIYFNNGTLRYSNSSTNAELARQVNLLSGGGAFDVSNAARTLLVSGKITGEALAADEGHYHGQGNLIKSGAGILEISNSTNDYTGQTLIEAGILRVVGAGRLGADISRLTVNNGGVLELNGSSQQMGLLMGTAGGVIRNGGAANSVLSIGHDDATYVAGGTNYGGGSGFAGSIQDGTGGGNVSLVKTRVGYQILSGVSSYTGATTVEDGFLQIGAGTTGTTHAARTGSGLHTVMGGATLAGNGIIGGDVLVQKDGVLSVGNYGQTVAQTLTIDGGLISQGAISLDLWTHTGGATTIDQLRFATIDGVVDISGNILINNMLAAPSTWVDGETVKLIHWGAQSVGRTFSGNLDLGVFALADEVNTYWDTRRFLLDGVIMVRSAVDGYIWDANSGSVGAQDGDGIWNTGNDNWVDDAMLNGSFVNGSDVWIGQNNGTANATITVNNSGGITVRDITFGRAGTDGTNYYHYTIAGGEAANNTLTLLEQSIITTDFVLEENFGTTISTRIAGGAWSKAGAGRLILSGNNTFTGDVNVLEGVLDIRHVNALGTTAGKTIVHGGATLEVRGGLTVAEALELNGSGVDDRGALLNQAGNNTFSGAITLASDSMVTSSADTLILSGVVSGVGDLIIRGGSSGAIVSLRGTSNHNTYTGDTHVLSGMLTLMKNANINAIAGTGQIHIGGAGEQAVLRLDQHHQIHNSAIVNLHGTGSAAGIFRVYGKQETIFALQSGQGEGFVENSNNASGDLTVSNTGVHRFGGIIRNGTGNGVLNFNKTGTGTQELTGANTYTGVTNVTNGVLRVTGPEGRLEGTPELLVGSNAVFELLNQSSENLGDRLNDEAAVELAGGRFRFSNDGSAGSFSETIGDVQIAAHSTIESQRAGSGGSSTLTMESLTRSNHGTVRFEGDSLGLDVRNRVFINGLDESLLDHGLIGAWAIVGNDFASYGANGVTAFEDYVASGESAWTFRDNIKLTAGTTLTAPRHINSLNVEQAAATTIDLGGNLLRLESGGLIVSGNYNSVISNGTLTAGTNDNAASELIIHQNSAAANTLNITASITDNGQGVVTLVKSGQGAMMLSGDNSYTGGLVLNEGRVVLNHANALPSSEGDLVLQAGTLDLNGHSVAVGGLSSNKGATAGIVVNNGATRATLTVGQGDASGDYYGVIQKGTGGVDLVKTGLGVITLRGNNTHDGQTLVNEGVLQVGHGNALGETGAGKETIVANGATLEIVGEGTYNETIHLSGFGFQGQGALVSKDAALRGGADQMRMMNVLLTGATSIHNHNKRIDLDGVFNAQGYGLTLNGDNLNGNSQITFEGGNNIQNLGNVYIKGGKGIWTGVNPVGDENKNLVVQSGAAAEFYNVSGARSKGIVLEGGTLRRTGNSITPNGTLTATDGLKLNTGSSYLANSNTSMTFHFGTIDRQTGGTINVDNNTTLGTTSSTNTNGILGGWAIVGNNTWAVNNTNGVDGAITGLATASYKTSTNSADWVATDNVSLSANADVDAATTINSLRITAASEVTLNDDLTIATGGILVTGAGEVNIDGEGSLKGSASGELIIHQNASAAMRIWRSIVDNGGATALVKTGTGTLELRGDNSYTGGTYINGGHGSASWGTLYVQDISDDDISSIGNSTGGDDNAIHFNHGRLAFEGEAETARNVYLHSGGGEFIIGSELTLTGVVQNDELREDEAFYAETGILRLSGGGVLTFAGSEANTYRGNTYVDNGTLVLGKDEGITAVAGNLIVADSGNVRWDSSDQIADSAVLTLNGGIADMNGFSEKLGGLVSTSDLSMLESSGSDTSELEIAVQAGSSYEYAGIIVGDIKLVKSGEGTQILTGDSSHEGGTHIQEGVLQVGNGDATDTLGSGGIEIDDGATLVVNSSSEYFNIEQDITGDGDFVQAGTGTTIFAEDFQHTYTGNTEIRAGTLVVNSTEVAATRGQFYVTGGKLSGTGVVNGNTVVKELGSIEIGDSTDPGYAAVLSINGDLGLQRSIPSEPARLVFDVFGGDIFNDSNLQEGGSAYTFASLSDYYNSGTTLDAYHYDAGNDFRSHDKLVVEGELTLNAGAVLMMNNVDHLIAAGDVFDLMDWSSLISSHAVDGAWNVDTDLILPELTAGLNWDRSLFLSHGIVTVIVPEPSRILLILLGGVALVTRRKRRQNAAC